MQDLIKSVEAIARVCHEANRAYCVSLGDTSQPSWDDAPDWQRQSAVTGVAGHLDGSITSARQSHESWLREKEATGWTYGPTKDPILKQHPCFVAYDLLPPSQQKKDALFKAVVDALR